MTTANDQIKLELQEQYDKSAATYDAHYRGSAGQYFMNRKLDTMLQLAELPRNSHLLEVGCASGVYTFQLAARGFQMTGLDLSPGCVQTATESAQQADLSNVNFVVGDAEDLSQFEDHSFDGVVSFSTLRYVPNPDTAIREIYRVLKPGGAAVVDFPNKLSPWFTVIKPLVTGKTHIHDHQYTTGHIKKLFQRAGFQGIKQRRILYTAKIFPAWSLPLMKTIDYIGERTPGLNQFAAIILSAGYKP